LAGAGRYSLRVFVLFSIVGRMIWTAAYLGLGYGFGVAIEAEAEFPNSLSGLLVSLVVLAVLGFMLHRNPKPPRSPASFWIIQGGAARVWHLSRGRME
jgi:membrane protein DedA with SNARE-associated domain